MLVASFVGLEKTQELYAEAIKEKYRFYSTRCDANTLKSDF